MFATLMLAGSLLLSNTYDTMPEYEERSIIISTCKNFVYLGKGKAKIDYTPNQDESTTITITLNLSPILVVDTGPLKKGERFIMNVDVRKFLEDRTLKPDTIRPVIKYVSTSVNQ